MVWHPARMAPIVMEAVSGTYERNKQGPGLPSFERMLANAERSAVHLEMRDTYDATDPGFLQWQQDSSTDYEWDDWIELIGAAVARGVWMRRLRIVSEGDSIPYGVRADLFLPYLPPVVPYERNAVVLLSDPDREFALARELLVRLKDVRPARIERAISG